MGLNNWKPSFPLVFLAHLAMASCIAARRVTLANGWSSGLALEVHCLSGDDDLGCQKMEAEHEINWEFEPSISQMTKFWCNLEKGNITSQLVLFNDRDLQLRQLCDNNGGECHWVAEPKGICFKNDDSKDESLCQKWLSKSGNN